MDLLSQTLFVTSKIKPHVNSEHFVSKALWGGTFYDFLLFSGEDSKAPLCFT